jgi:predicted ArsR family transcriptional regulator
MKVTAKEVADHLGIDYVVASGLMTALVDKGIAKHVENRKHPSGKGKPTRVFEVGQTVTLELFATPAQNVDAAA